MRSPRVLAVLVLAILLGCAVMAFAQEPQEVPPEAAAGMAIGMIIVTGLIILVSLAIQIAIIVFMYRDAEARGQSGALWAILGFLFGLLALIIWLIIRPKQ
jgi:Na+/H+-dicarboxylate symporter